jgi:ornithine carbamoyltransferase
MLNHQSLWSLDGLTRGDLLTLIGSARQFQRAAAQAGSPPTPLRGKNLALLSDDHASAEATAFLRAATELGAQVARVRATEPGDAGRRDPRDMAGLLGQLYDAIECQGLGEGELRELERDAGVPVFNGMASPSHPLHAIATLMALQEQQGEQPLPARGAARQVAGLLGLPLDEIAGAAPTPPSEEAVARHTHHLLQAALSCTLA